MGLEVEESKMEPVGMVRSADGRRKLEPFEHLQKGQSLSEAAGFADVPNLKTKEPGRRRRVLSEKAKRARSDAETVPPAVEGPSLDGDEQEKKKRRRRSLEQDDHREAVIAAGMGFPHNFLTEEEIRAGVVGALGGIEQSNYIVIRNHILAKWRQNVDKWLPESQILENIRAEHKPLVRAAYRFLSQAGYINFGVAPAIKERVRTGGPKATVIVIGAGLAGLAAARQLLAFGHRVIVLEGRARPGGRVHTRQMDAGGQSAAADLGGSVLTGTDGNPLGVLARQLKLPMHHIRSDPCPIYGLDGQRADEELDKRVEADFNRLLDKAEETRKAMATVADSISLGSTLDTLQRSYRVAQSEAEQQLLDWHMANLEYANAGLLHDLSLAFWDQDDPHEMAGDHCFLTGGNGRLITALIEGLPIFYSKTVRTIRYSDTGVRVHTADGQVFEGDMALSTIPLGCLKRGDVTFEPPLPREKEAAIRRLGFGLLNKVALLFPHNFWGNDLDTFGRVAPDSHRRGEYFLFYSYAAVSGGSLLLALVAGEAAKRFEKVPSTDVIADVMGILRSIYEPKGVTVPNPLSTLCTRWGADPFAYGSYSHVAVGASGDDYDVLAESCGNGRLFFAGEATTRWHPATMHGAFLTGLREAGWMDATARARARGQPLPIQIAPSNLSVQAVTLAEVFKRPDMEFGGFSVVLDPRSSSPSAPALLRLVLRSVHSLTKPIKLPQETRAQPNKLPKEKETKPTEVRHETETQPKSTSGLPVKATQAPPKSAGNPGGRPQTPVLSASPSNQIASLDSAKPSTPPASESSAPHPTPTFLSSQPKSPNLASYANPSNPESSADPPNPQSQEPLSERATVQMASAPKVDALGGAASAQGLGRIGSPRPASGENGRGLGVLKAQQVEEWIRPGGQQPMGGVNGLLGTNSRNEPAEGQPGSSPLQAGFRLSPGFGATGFGTRDQTSTEDPGVRLFGTELGLKPTGLGAGLGQSSGPSKPEPEADSDGRHAVGNVQAGGPVNLTPPASDPLTKQTNRPEDDLRALSGAGPLNSAQETTSPASEKLPDLSTTALPAAASQRRNVNVLSELPGTSGRVIAGLDSVNGAEQKREESRGEGSWGRLPETVFPSGAVTTLRGPLSQPNILPNNVHPLHVATESQLLAESTARSDGGNGPDTGDNELSVSGRPSNNRRAPFGGLAASDRFWTALVASGASQLDSAWALPIFKTDRDSSVPDGQKHPPNSDVRRASTGLMSPPADSVKRETLMEATVSGRPSTKVESDAGAPKNENSNGKVKGALKKSGGQAGGWKRGKKRRRRISQAGAFTPGPKELAVYTVLTRGQAEQLREVKGGDRARLQMLVTTFGVKLVGRQGLGSAGESLLTALQGPHLVAGGLLPRGKNDVNEKPKAKKPPEANGAQPALQLRPKRPRAEAERKRSGSHEARARADVVRTTKEDATVHVKRPKPELGDAVLAIAAANCREPSD